MTARRFSIILLPIIAAVCGCGARPKPQPEVAYAQRDPVTLAQSIVRPARPLYGRFHFHFEETTGDSQYIEIEGVDFPIRLDPEQSDKKALSTFQGLSWPILYPRENDRNIFLVGTYDPKSEKFILKKWSIKAPFHRLWMSPEEDGPSFDTKTTVANQLVRSDFRSFDAFDPKDPEFHPDDYVIK
ncbi:MAG: hypothetical protein ABIY70_01040 [Capsulimonas sp.]|uniref:hypothetical protein n=1 Tax=Capsulimonas sp. TaxID=2494211 RepID=UPI003263F2D4